MSRRVDRKQANRVVREQLAAERRRVRVWWTSAIVVIALAIAVGVGYSIYRSQQPKADAAVPSVVTADKTGIPVGSGKVNVEVYLDYQCPACRAFEEANGQLLKQLVADNKITLVIHPVAILDRFSTNQYSSRSAAGAGCAADAGKIVEYGDALYANQPPEGGAGHTDDELIQLASGAGLPADSFGSCLKDDMYADWVKQVTEAMSKRGVNSTPTVFVDGTQLEDRSPEGLAAAVEAASK